MHLISSFFELVIGALFALACVALARRFGARGERRLYARWLVVAAVIYVIFAVAGGAAPFWTAVELAGLLPFAGIGWLGLRYSPRWLAIGWAGHAVWDFGLHLMAGTPPFVPGWYPVMCLG